MATGTEENEAVETGWVGEQMVGTDIEEPESGGQVKQYVSSWSDR